MGYDEGITNNTLQPKVGWGTSGKLRTGSTFDMVTAQAVFPVGGTYTIEFSKDNNPDSNNPIFAEALITWIIEGNYITRRVNIGDGVSVSGVAQGFKVQMMDVTVDNGGGAPNGVPYGVACQVSIGVRGTTTQGPTLVPQVTIPPTPPNGADGLYVIGAGATVIVPVLSDAGIIAVYMTAIDETTFTLTAGEILVTQLYAGGSTKTYDLFNFLGSWVPITPGSDSIALTNRSANNVIVTVTYEIDG